MNSMIRDTLIDVLTQFEISPAQLYVAFGRVFPAVSDRWADFAAEEWLHAQWLTKLKIYLSKEVLTLKDAEITIRRVNRPAVGIYRTADYRAATLHSIYGRR